MKYIHHPVPMDDVIGKVTGQAVYVDDIHLQNMLHAKILYSPYAHAKLLSIDTKEAEALPGVHAVISIHNAPDTLYNRILRNLNDPLPRTERMFDSTLRGVSDAVAAVAADTEEIAQKALKLIKVEYEPLPVVLDPEDALKEDSVKLYPDGNLLKHQFRECGDVDRAFEEAPVKIHSETRTKAVHHAALEPHGYIARWTMDNNVEIWGPEQGVHRTQIMLAGILGLPISKVQYHGLLIGGAFGGKDGIIGEAYAALLSKYSGGRPVKLLYTRKAAMTCVYTRHAMNMYTDLGLTEDGEITSILFRGFMNAGPYCGGSINVLDAMCGKMFKVYRAPNQRFDGRAVYTDSLVGGAMRGFGSPKVFTALEIAVSQAARKLNMDPVELRLKNLALPYDKDPLTGDSLYNGHARDCLIKGRGLFRWDERKRDIPSKNTERYAYGLGVATAMHGNGVAPFAPDITVASIQLNEDGSILLRTGVADHGAGTYTLMKMIAAEILDMPLEQICLVHSDTYAGEYDTGAGASRNTWTGGSAVAEAAKKTREKLREIASEMLEVPADRIELKDGEFRRVDGLAGVNRKDIAWYAMDKKRMKLTEAVSYASRHNAGSYGAHFCEVRVDKETGHVKVMDYTAVCDVGTALNPLLLSGQIEGAIAMGIGMALYEELKLDENGIPVNANFHKYHVPRASEMPRMTIDFVEDYEEGGPFGGKSIGEASIVPVAPCVINAVNDALGANLTDLPITPEKILAELRA